jgi:hypothetical protein
VSYSMCGKAPSALSAGSRSRGGEIGAVGL